MLNIKGRVGECILVKIDACMICLPCKQDDLPSLTILQKQHGST